MIRVLGLSSLRDRSTSWWDVGRTWE